MIYKKNKMNALHFLLLMFEEQYLLILEQLFGINVLSNTLKVPQCSNAPLTLTSISIFHTVIETILKVPITMHKYNMIYNSYVYRKIIVFQSSSVWFSYIIGSSSKIKMLSYLYALPFCIKSWRTQSDITW